MPAGDAQQVFSRAVVRYLARHDFRPRNFKMLGQFHAIGLRQIGHQRKILNAPMVYPLPYLAHTHFRLPLGRADGHQRIGHLGACHTHKIGQPPVAGGAEWS